VTEAVSYAEELRETVAELDQLVRRLRLFTPRTWRTHREGIQHLIKGLVRLAERAENASLIAPDVPDHVLADAVAVIGADLVEALRTGASPVLLKDLRDLIAAALVATR
jgi:hypothetical protein